ncbi:hypothetical protein TNCV_2507521 [Trichonephila clavipes]|nr:hypothetical protein TNCV_2507521 [Trichonephila clavipes]
MELPPSSPSTNLTRGLAARRLFRVHPRRKGTVHLQISMPSPGFSAVSVTNHYAGWAASEKEICKIGTHIEDYLDQLEGVWLSENGLDDENSDEKYNDADEI